ncbi:MAG: potassium/proton antiporter [Bacteroidaceae bacterium]|nr:potassium/proton antiporter [Bacteroidaceae bacterium]
MTFTPENLLLLGSLLVFVSILVSKTGYRFGIPTLLLFLFTGMFFGSSGLGLQFDSPKGAQFIGMFSLCIILFTGGMDTKFKDIRSILGPGILLATLGVVLTTIITGGFIYILSSSHHFGIELSLMVCMLLAATMSSTDSASVFSLLRSQGMGLKHKLRPILELESGSNDPMAYMLTVALTSVALSGSNFSMGNLVGSIAMQFAIGGLLGFGGGRFATWLMNRINHPNASLYPVLLLSLCFMTFTITDMLNGNGYLAVYIAGLVVGNRRLSYRREMTTFMEGLTWLVQIVMFISLGLLVNPQELWEVAPVALAIGLFMMFVARPVSVYLCMLPFWKYPIRAKHFLSWVGLRGAVPILFATYPVIHGVKDAAMLFNIVFVVTLLSLLTQGTTLSTMARWLKLDEPEEKTGNEFGIELPEHLTPSLCETTITKAQIENGALLADQSFPKGTLVMLVKRGESVIVPNGKLELHVGDILLTINEDSSNSPCG